MVTPGLVLDGLHYWTGDTDIVNGVYLELRPGTICGLVGANGSGKTTLLNLAAGQLTPTSGSVVIDGIRFSSPRRRRRFASIAYLTQRPLFPRRLRVRTLVESIRSVGRRCDAVLELADVRRVGDLSAGQVRLLEVLFVLALRRRYVLLDEPFTGVEPVYVERMVAEIRQIVQDGCAVLLTDQQYRSILDMAHDLYLLRGGTCLRLDVEDRQQRLRSEGYL